MSSVDSITPPPFPNKLHACPFQRCHCSYTRLGKLRDHLVKQRTILDETHPATDATWEQAERDGLLKVFTRPKCLTDTEKEARKKENRKRCWHKNKANYLDKQRESRENIRKALDAAIKLTTIHKIKNEQITALEAPVGSTTVIATQYNITELKDWLGKDICMTTFPKFVTYFYPPEKWPYVSIRKKIQIHTNDNSQPSKRLISDALPGRTLYNELRQRCHPYKLRQHANINRSTSTHNISFNLQHAQTYDLHTSTRSISTLFS